MTVCKVKNLCKDYPDFSLKNVSFELIGGTVTGFIGRNGAGKTTTVKSMLNLVRKSGEITFFGMPLNDKTEAEIKQKIGYSSGTVNYYPKKKIKDIAAVTKRFYKTWDETEYRKYLNLFSLDENKTPSELSEGMKVKLNLLFALSHGAELLILDEPTSGLDPFSRDELCAVFSALKENGTAVFFSTHIISDLEKCADNIIYISGGEIVFSGTKNGFSAKFSKPDETLEDTFLWLEREKK